MAIGAAALKIKERLAVVDHFGDVINGDGSGPIGFVGQGWGARLIGTEEEPRGLGLARFMDARGLGAAADRSADRQESEHAEQSQCFPPHFSLPIFRAGWHPAGIWDRPLKGDDTPTLASAGGGGL